MTPNDVSDSSVDHWRVGRFRSSSNPQQIVLVLSVGAAIERDEKHHSFVEWAYSHPSSLDEAYMTGWDECWEQWSDARSKLNVDVDPHRAGYQTYSMRAKEPTK